MALSGLLRASGYILVLAFHKMDSAGGVAAAAGLKARFPDPASLFADLRAARTEKTTSASYLKQAVAADAPITYPHLGVTLGYAPRLGAHPTGRGAGHAVAAAHRGLPV